MTQRAQLVALGELLIDFTPFAGQGNPLFGTKSRRGAGQCAGCLYKAGRLCAP